MLVPSKFMASSTMSSISLSPTVSLINPDPPSSMAMPSSRFFHIPFAAKSHLLRLNSVNSSHTSRPESSDFDSSSMENPGSSEKSKKSQAVSSNDIVTKLKRYGISGVLAYGLLNTAYYLTTFLVVWLYVAPSPGRMGYLAAIERFLKVLAMVWAGSQVTKLMRAGGALALAPFVDRGLSWFTVKFGFKSQGKAFITIAGFCFGLAFVMFVVVTLLWA